MFAYQADEAWGARLNAHEPRRLILAEGQLEFLKTIGAARIGAMAGVAAALTGFFL
jgi:hypothetical protein